MTGCKRWYEPRIERKMRGLAAWRTRKAPRAQRVYHDTIAHPGWLDTDSRNRVPARKPWLLPRFWPPRTKLRGWSRHVHPSNRSKQKRHGSAPGTAVSLGRQVELRQRGHGFSTSKPCSGSRATQPTTGFHVARWYVYPSFDRSSNPALLTSDPAQRLLINVLFISTRS